MRRALLRDLKNHRRVGGRVRSNTFLAVLALILSLAWPVWAAERGGEPAPVGEKNMQAAGSMVPGVGFDGEFFPPAGSPRKLGVLVLGGSDGGVPSRRARIIAQKGFPVLALAYFKTGRTPPYLDMIPLEYFDEPIEWLIHNQHTHGGRIVVIGESKGAELALLLAARKPEISGVVAFVPGAVVFQGMPKDYRTPRSSWSHGGEPIPFVPYDLGGLPEPNDVLSIYRNSLKQREAVRRALIPVARIKGPVLLFSAADDRMWPSVEMSDMIMRSLREQGFGYPHEHFPYEHAGHTMTEYYMMGGTEEGNRKARIDSNERMLLFLNKLAAGQPAAD